jgi:antirestriction protein ArdC
MGRAVRKGERAIWILAPLVARDEVAADGDSAPAVRGFRRVAVFDLAQTDGAPLPSPCERLKGEVSGEQYPRLVAVAHRIGFLVDDAPLPEGTNGECHFAERRLRIRTGNSEVQRVKTLAHELGHAVLHEFEVDRAKAELEAESIAYVVCRSLGIDSGTYSFGYVATWAGGGDAAITAIRGSCDRIASTAHMILEAAASFSSGRIKGGASG